MMPLGGMTGVICYLDDILLAGETVEFLDKKLDEVVTRLKKVNIKIND